MRVLKKDKGGEMKEDKPGKVKSTPCVYPIPYILFWVFHSIYVPLLYMSSMYISFRISHPICVPLRVFHFVYPTLHTSNSVYSISGIPPYKCPTPYLCPVCVSHPVYSQFVYPATCTTHPVCVYPSLYPISCSTPYVCMSLMCLAFRVSHFVYLTFCIFHSVFHFVYLTFCLFHSVCVLLCVLHFVCVLPSSCTPLHVCPTPSAFLPPCMSHSCIPPSVCIPLHGCPTPGVPPSMCTPLNVCPNPCMAHFVYIFLPCNPLHVGLTPYVFHSMSHSVYVSLPLSFNP